MTKQEPALLNKIQRHVIFAVTFGNILEWYDVYIYIYWASTISSLFFKQTNHSLQLFNTIVIFMLGFLCRPLGGLFFGRLGDLVGRKKTFAITIFFMTIPTFLIGCLPVYSQIGIFAPILLALLRILQTLPAGGELPGVFCYLYENASPENRKFMTSFSGVGNQIGIALSAIECFLLEMFLPENILNNWGWRISFILGGVLGISGFYLRYKLQETKLFQEMVVHHKISQESIIGLIRRNWKKIIQGITLGAAQTTAFHFVSILFPIFLFSTKNQNQTQNLIASILLMILITIPLPIYGFLGSKYKAKNLLISACIGMILLLYPLYYSISSQANYSIFILATFSLFFSCITALWPYFVSHLFSTSERYTGVGLSFNIADGVFGGISTIIAFYLFNTSGEIGPLIWILLATCLISLISFIKIKE